MPVYLVVKSSPWEACQQEYCEVAYRTANIWFPRVRQTRSGREFSAYAGPIEPLRTKHPVDLSALLQLSTAFEDAAAGFREDHEDYEPPEPASAIPSVATLPSPLTHGLPSSSVKRDREEADNEDPRAPKQSRKNWKRRQKRAAEYSEHGHVPSQRTIDNVVAPAKEIPTNLEREQLPSKVGAYAAKNDKYPDAKKEWTLEGLLSAGFELIKWDGRVARPMIDHENVIFAVLAGQPDDPSYERAAEDMFSAMETEASQADFRPEEKAHRRGNFAALAGGISYGNGQTEPAVLKEGVTGRHALTIQRLVGHAAVCRMAAFASASFALWAPRVYKYYEERLETMYRALPHLKPNFPRSIFACATFNFGPYVCTFKHRDVLNCPFGWCAIQALGKFDPTKGGHIILWDAKVVIEFPPGSTILIPSATVAHSNLPIAPGERRASFTQYCAGGIFRWVDNGCRLESKLAEEDPEEYRRICGLKAGRWVEGLKLFSTLDELLMKETSTSDVIDLEY